MEFVTLCPVAVVPPREHNTIRRRVKAVDVVALPLGSDILRDRLVAIREDW
jgi:hypothetical protein